MWRHCMSIIFLSLALHYVNVADAPPRLTEAITPLIVFGISINVLGILIVIGCMWNRKRRSLSLEEKGQYESHLEDTGVVPWCDFAGHPAGAASGRIIYGYLGDQVLCNGYVVFDISAVDMLLSRTIKIRVATKLNVFGEFSGMYALDGQTIVLIGFDEKKFTLRQVLIKINLKHATGEIVLCRNYQEVRFRVPFPIRRRLETIVGTNIAVTISYNNEGFIYPVNPMSHMPCVHITDLIRQARAFASLFNNVNQPGVVTIFARPFVIRNDTLGFFLKRSLNGESYFNFSAVVILNLKDGSIKIQNTTYSSNLFSSPGESWVPHSPHDDYWNQASDKEVAFVARFNEKIAKLCVFNTVIMHWDEGKVKEVGKARMIGSNGVWKFAKWNRFRLIRSSTRVPSLANLARIAVQKKRRQDDKLDLEIIAERIQCVRR